MIASAPAVAGSDSKTAEPVRSPARGASVAYDYDFGTRGDRVTGADGTWSGSWEGRYVDAANGRYEGTFRGTYQGPATASYSAPPYAAAAYPAPTPGYYAGQPAYAYGNAGYGVPIYVPTQPVVTRTITVVEEEIIGD